MKIKSDVIISLLMCLLCSYVVTGISLVVLALFMFQFQLSKEIVSIAIIVIYVISSFLGGFIAGKKRKTKRYIWGLLIGLGYFVIMLLLSLLVNHSVGEIGNQFITTLILCGAGGMLGGMLS